MGNQEILSSVAKESWRSENMQADSPSLLGNPGDRSKQCSSAAGGHQGFPPEELVGFECP